MAGKKVKLALAKDLSLWQMEGEIEQETYDILAKRYHVDEFNLNETLKYLGVLGSGLAIIGLLGFVSVATGSRFLSLLLLLGLSYTCFFYGAKWRQDPTNQYPHTTRLALSMSVFLLGSSLGLLGTILQIQWAFGWLVLSGIWIGLAVAMAYYSQATFLLVLANLLLFHWVGSWTSMFGRGSYVFSVQDPLIMTLAAAGIIYIGQLHREWDRPHAESFARAYQAIGLVYLNMSLLILSIFAPYVMKKLSYPSIFGNKVLFIVVAMGAALLQIVLGSRLHRKIFTGFGVTFFAIHMFTRFHELMWDRVHKGLFFLIGGAMLLALSVGLERKLRQAKEEVQHVTSE